jgi:hypothetical protein
MTSRWQVAGLQFAMQNLSITSTLTSSLRVNFRGLRLWFRRQRSGHRAIGGRAASEQAGPGRRCAISWRRERTGERHSEKSGGGEANSLGLWAEIETVSAPIAYYVIFSNRSANLGRLGLGRKTEQIKNFYSTRLHKIGGLSNSCASTGLLHVYSRKFYI